MVDHPGAAPKDLMGLDDEFRRFMNCGAEDPGGEVPLGSGGMVRLGATAAMEERGPQTDASASIGEGVQDDGKDNTAGEEVQDVSNGSAAGDRDSGRQRGRGRAKRPSPGFGSLCSHSHLDSQSELRSPCYKCLVGTSNTHGLPGGAVCCGASGDLGQCPRAWA